ncbi:uncharacterized protein [Triticum aestivum]|uniref:uncharacterized protein n=1 Tax=Triticum aestivum TaxID=4565 RepID=UPI001D0233A7|nr:uncharacterized protein LOC123117050 [Triticum aestivum]
MAFPMEIQAKASTATSSAPEARASSHPGARAPRHRAALASVLAGNLAGPPDEPGRPSAPLRHPLFPFLLPLASLSLLLPGTDAMDAMLKIHLVAVLHPSQPGNGRIRLPRVCPLPLRLARVQHIAGCATSGRALPRHGCCHGRRLPTPGAPSSTLPASRLLLVVLEETNASQASARTTPARRFPCLPLPASSASSRTRHPLARALTSSSAWVAPSSTRSSQPSIARPGAPSSRPARPPPPNGLKPMVPVTLHS